MISLERGAGVCITERSPPLTRNLLPLTLPGPLVGGGEASTRIPQEFIDYPKGEHSAASLLKGQIGSLVFKQDWFRCLTIEGFTRGSRLKRSRRLPEESRSGLNVNAGAYHSSRSTRNAAVTTESSIVSTRISLTTSVL